MPPLFLFAESPRTIVSLYENWRLLVWSELYCEQYFSQPHPSNKGVPKCLIYPFSLALTTTPT